MGNEIVYLDRLDRILKERIDTHNGISLTELRVQYPELTDFPYYTLWYRINTLAENGYIRIERARRNIICYSVE